MKSSAIRFTLDREELVTIIWGLEALIEDAKTHYGLNTVESEIAVKEKLDQILRRFDLKQYARQSGITLEDYLSTE